MLTLHDMDAVLGEIGEQLANRPGFSNSLLWFGGYLVIYEIDADSFGRLSRLKYTIVFACDS